MLVLRCLVDTNVLLRISKLADPNHAAADHALSRLVVSGAALYYTHQNMAELWNTMTRPHAQNGFGLTVADADRALNRIELGMHQLPDSPAVYREWRRIVLHYGVSGVQVHDARLAASMYANGVQHILTFNGSDFDRFAGLVAIHPATL